MFHSLFLQLENDLREIEMWFFITNFYSEMFFRKTPYMYKNLLFIHIFIEKNLVNVKNTWNNYRKTKNWSVVK